MKQTRLLFKGTPRALISHTLKQLRRIQKYDADQLRRQTDTGIPGNFVQLSPAIKGAVTSLVSLLTAELEARG